MNFNVCAFTKIGSSKTKNDDRVLVCNKIYSEGIVNLENLDSVFAFVADGIGGSNAGDFASEFVLQQILNEQEEINIPDKKGIELLLHDINNKLLEKCKNNINLLGAGTTLAGLILKPDNYLCLSVGDSQIWFGRNNDLFKLSKDQVLDDKPNSPLISYFGGVGNKMLPEFYDTISELRDGDLFLICSDGLLKTISFQMIKSILFSSQPISLKLNEIHKSVCKFQNIDDVSCILIQINDSE